MRREGKRKCRGMKAGGIQIKKTENVLKNFCNGQEEKAVQVDIYFGVPFKNPRNPLILCFIDL